MPKKRKFIILTILVVVLISLSIFYTYAYNVTINKTTGTADLTYNIDITDTSGTTVTVPAGKTKLFDFNLTNNNGVTIKYALAYSGTKPETVTIAQLNTSKSTVSGTINNNTTKNITLAIVNKSDTNYTYTIIPVKGYENGGNLSAPEGYTLITGTISIGPGTANDKIIDLAGDCTSWESGFSGVCKTNDHEYRYIGANVNNWVRFNNDMYRIIGVFDDNSHGQTGQYLVKLIAADTLTAASWGATNRASAYTTYSTYNNNWKTANANILLNEYFLNATDTSTTYKSCSDWTYFFSNNNYKTKDCSNIVGYGIQTANLRNYIQPVTWYLKGYNSNSYSKQNFYTCERSDTTTISNCTSGNSGGYATKVENKSIGLMYVSDYLYASGYYASTNTAQASQQYYGQQNWLYNGYEWTMTPVGSGSTFSFNVHDGGVYHSNAGTPYALRPTFYLKANVMYESGTGSFSDPYIISCDNCNGS